MHKGNKRGTTKEGHNTSLQIDFKIDKMKKIILLAAIFAAVTVQAQTVDTVKNAIQVKPVVVNALQKDTCFQVGWSVCGINRNDTTGANSNVFFFDRKGRFFSEVKVRIPYSVLSVWLEDIVIDNYILTFLGLQKRQ